MNLEGIATRFRKYIIVGVLALFLPSVAGASITVIALASALAQGGLEHVDNDAPGGGEEICLSGGRPSYDCNRGTSIGEGICLSGGRPSYDCSRATSIGEGICLSRGRPSYDCNRGTSLGEGICLSGGRPSYDCSRGTAIGEGICLAGGRPSYDCSRGVSVGQGICLSTGRPSHDCTSGTSIGQGLCLAKGHRSYRCSNMTVKEAISLGIIDITWAWDSFLDAGESEQWRCRGRGTGQFADDDKCTAKPKIDNTWPEKFIQ